MDYQYLLVTLSLSVTVAASDIDLPEMFYEICPYSDICNRTASKSLNVEGLIPCCSSCKCDDQCGLRFDCCFDYMDKYRLKDKGVVACVNPMIGDERKTTFQEAYWMVQTCKYVTKDGFKNEMTIPCELYNVRGQSVAEPVSSKEKDSIYVNAECAKCNDVYNFTKWNYLFLADHHQVGPSVWKYKNNTDKHVEHIAYIPPLKEDWSAKKCFRNIFDTCDTNSTFKKLCHTLNVPFQQYLRMAFRNPFCVLCGKQLRLLKECNDKGRLTTSNPFSVLIDTSIIEYSKLRKSIMMNKSLKQDCSDEMAVISDSCYQIYCPDGMLMTPTGCRYFIHRWYIPSFRIQFKLLAIVGNELPIATLNAFTPDERKKPLRWMKLPCRKVKASVIEVFYEIGKDDQKTVGSFIVRLLKLTPDGIDPSVLFPTLHKCLKYNWYIEILGKTYAFHSTLDKQNNYIQDGQQMHFNKLTRKKEDVPKPKLYEHLATGSGPLSVPINTWKRGAILLKTFFCNQISLQMNEVEVLYGEIWILSKNVTLGNNEFAITSYPTMKSDGRYTIDLNITTFSVCLEDYDNYYYQRRSTSAQFSMTFLFERLVLFHAMIQLVM